MGQMPPRQARCERKGLSRVEATTGCTEPGSSLSRRFRNAGCHLYADARPGPGRCDIRTNVGILPQCVLISQRQAVAGLARAAKSDWSLRAPPSGRTYARPRAFGRSRRVPDSAVHIVRPDSHPSRGDVGFRAKSSALTLVQTRRLALDERVSASSCSSR